MKNLELFLFLAEEFDSGKDGGGGRPGKRHLKQVSAEMTNTKKKKKKILENLEKGNRISPAVKSGLCLTASVCEGVGRPLRARRAEQTACPGD